MANLQVAMQYLNGTWRVLTGASVANEAHGVTFSVNQTTTNGQLRAALDSGAGSGDIKLKAVSFSA